MSANACAEGNALLRRALTSGSRGDPYPSYRTLQRDHPTLRTGSGCLIFSRYEDVSEILGNPAFAVKDETWFDEHLPAWRSHPSVRLFLSCLVFRNGDEHLRLRRAMAPAFAPARLRRWSGVALAATQVHLDDLADTGDPVNLHERYSLPVVRDTICALVGVPAEAGPELYEQVQPILALLDPVVSERTVARAERAGERLRSRLERVLSERRALPRDDLASDVADLGDEAAVGALMLTLAAGFDTTVTLIDHTIAALLNATGTQPTEAAVTESLRHDPPLHLVTRVTRSAVKVGGIDLPPGQEVMALLAAAHRDPERFSNPEMFDTKRESADLLAFGGGPHYCLGARLARTIAETAIPALLKRHPRIRSAGAPRPGRRVTLTGWSSLPVRLS